MRNYNPYKAWEGVITKEKQMKLVDDISNDVTRGRAMGTRGNQIVAKMIKDIFTDYGLVPYGKAFTQSFRSGSTIGRNVIGMIPAATPSDEYIVVSAHYDHIGALNGYVYRGADNNASGVTALINLAEIFSRMKKNGRGPEKNIIFAAFDGKEMSMCGSKYFVNTLTIPNNKILVNINLDQIGSILEPPAKSSNYIIVLGNNTLPRSKQGLLNYANWYYNLNIDLHTNYYGSENFTEMMYNFSDQHSFADVGIPALFFTSGIHKHTNKTTDTPDTIDYDVLKNRTLLIFYFIMNYK